MEASRTLRAKSNIIFTMIFAFLKIIAGFFVRTILIRVLGVEYLGINSLFAGILSMLSVTELGIGSALVFSMYKPVAESDSEKVKQLLQLYKNIYNIIGTTIMVLGLAIMPFLEYLIVDINSVPNDINIYIVYLFFLLNSGVSYFVAHKRSLIFVCQRSDIENIIDGVGQILSSALQITLLLLFKNYYVYLVAILIFVVIQNVSIYISAEKMFPDFKGRPETKLSKEERKIITNNIGALCLHKIGAVVAGIGIDSIIISACLGIVVLGYYSNYILITTYLTTIVTLIITAVKGSIGNAIAKNTVEQNYKLFNTLTYILFFMIGFCSISLMLLLNPFISVWLGSDYLLDFNFCILLAIQFFVANIRLIVNSYKECLGYFKQDMFKPLIEAIVNIVLSILLVKILGLYGVVLGTIGSMVFVCLWLEPLILYKHYFKTHVYKYWRKFFYYIALIIVSTIICILISKTIVFGGIKGLILRALTCLFIPNCIFILGTCFTNEFKEMKLIIKKILKKA